MRPDQSPLGNLTGPRGVFRLAANRTRRCIQRMILPGGTLLRKLVIQLAHE
jgi:hypothetical protein